MKPAVRILQQLRHLAAGMLAAPTLLALVLATSAAIIPSLAYAQLSFYIPCSGSKARAEKRTEDIRGRMGVNTVGMRISDIEDLYCVTREKCVALGYCKAATPEEQAAADKLAKQLAAEEARLQRERQAKAAAAERERERARRQAEEERQRKAAAEAADKARREKIAADEMQRRKLSAQEAKRLVDAREDARKKMPAQPEKCTIDYPAYSQKVDFTPIIMLHARAEKDHAAVDRSKMCNGRPGRLDPLQCDKPANFFGARFGSCTAMMHCPARQETRTCARASAQ